MKFKKKPALIEGEIWSEEKEIVGVVKQEISVYKNGKYALQKTKFYLKTAKGEVPLDAGDLICGSSPNYVVIKKDTLEKVYEEDVG